MSLTTRQEKNWESSVFGEPIQYSPKKKLLGKEDNNKERYGFCQNNGKLYSKHDVDYAHSFKRSKSTNTIALRVQAEASKPGTNQKRFKVEEMISPAADWANPQHQPTQNRKNKELGVIVERRGRKQRANDSHMNNIGLSNISQAVDQEITSEIDKSMRIV